MTATEYDEQLWSDLIDSISESDRTQGELVTLQVRDIKEALRTVEGIRESGGSEFTESSWSVDGQRAYVTGWDESTPEGCEWKIVLVQ